MTDDQIQTIREAIDAIKLGDPARAAQLLEQLLGDEAFTPEQLARAAAEKNLRALRRGAR